MEILKKIHDSGFEQIYPLVARYIKRKNRGHIIPEHVLNKVGEQYLKEIKTKKLNNWAWFYRVLDNEVRKDNAENEIKKGEAFKKQGVCQNMKDIMKGMFS